MPTICSLPVSRPGETRLRCQARYGNLRIIGGQAHVALARLHADFNVVMVTDDTGAAPHVVAHAIEHLCWPADQWRFPSVGALLSLRDATMPYPVDLQVANGPTHAKLGGTVQDPLNFAGTDLKLELAGTDMEQAVAVDRHRLSEEPHRPRSKAIWTIPMASSTFATSSDSLDRATCEGTHRGRSRPEASRGDCRCHVPAGRSRRSSAASSAPSPGG